MIIYENRKPVGFSSGNCVGVTGENLAFTQEFLIKELRDISLEYTIHLRFPDGSVNSVIPDAAEINSLGTKITWIVKKNDIFMHGYFELQLEGRNSEGFIYQTEIVTLYADESIPVEEREYENPNSETLKLRDEAYGLLCEISEQQKKIEDNYELINETDLSNKVDLEQFNAVADEKEDCENKISDKLEIIDSSQNYPSVQYLENYFYSADEAYSSEEVDEKLDSRVNKNFLKKSEEQLLCLKNIEIDKYGLHISIRNNHIRITGTLTENPMSGIPLGTEFPLNFFVTGEDYIIWTHGRKNSQGRALLNILPTAYSVTVSSNEKTFYHTLLNGKVTTGTEYSLSLSFPSQYMGKEYNIDAVVQIAKGTNTSTNFEPYYSIDSLSYECVQKENLGASVTQLFDEKADKSAVDEVNRHLNDKVDYTGFDTSPQKNSPALMTSGAIYNALENKYDKEIEIGSATLTPVAAVADYISYASAEYQKTANFVITTLRIKIAVNCSPSILTFENMPFAAKSSCAAAAYTNLHKAVELQVSSGASRLQILPKEGGFTANELITTVMIYRVK